MLVGYARVSTLDQSLTLQEDALNEAGCERIFSDVASGAQTTRAGLAEALGFLRAGDTLVVWRLDRLGRSLTHLFVYIIWHDEAKLEIRVGCECCSNLTNEKKDDLKRKESLAKRKSAQKKLQRLSSTNNLPAAWRQDVESISTDAHLGGYERRVTMDHTPCHPEYRPDYPPIASDVPWLTREWPWDCPPPKLLGRVLVLQCPVCGFFYNHHEQVTKLDRRDKGWTGDGDCARVSFMCENSHVWSLNFGFHKGQMYVYATVDYERASDEDSNKDGEANPSL